MPRYFVLVAMATMVAAIGWLDVLTGPEVGMSLFYLGPIALTAWYVGPRSGIALSVAAAGCWYWADLSARGMSVLPVSTWNAFTRLAIYAAAAVLLSLLHADRKRLHVLLLQAEQNAHTDLVTGLANRRRFYERLREELPRLKRRLTPMSLAYLDLDNFKRINDRHGHAAGDAALKAVAEALRSNLRAGDLPARLGGDEFAVALWDTDLAGAKVVVKRIAAAIERIAHAYPDAELGASIGLTALDPAEDIETALRAADAAMYAEKAARKAGPHA